MSTTYAKRKAKQKKARKRNLTASAGYKKLGAKKKKKRINRQSGLHQFFKL